MSDKNLFIRSTKIHADTFLSSWNNNYLSWKKLKDKVLLIKYEDLVSKREETLKKILQFIFKLRNINFTLDTKKIENVLKNTTFEKLKNLEKEKGFRESIKGDDGKQIPFFDKGKTRDWSKTLDKNLSQEIERCFENEMKELGYL